MRLGQVTREAVDAEQVTREVVDAEQVTREAVDALMAKGIATSDQVESCDGLELCSGLTDKLEQSRPCEKNAFQMPGNP